MVLAALKFFIKLIFLVAVVLGLVIGNLNNVEALNSNSNKYSLRNGNVRFRSLVAKSLVSLSLLASFGVGIPVPVRALGHKRHSF